MSSLILKVFNNIWPMLTVFIVAIAFIRFFYLQNHRERFVFYKEVCYLISIIYIWLLFEILTMSELNATVGMNLVPFSEITRYEFGSKLFMYNVIGNMLIFVPFGYLIGIYVNPKKIWPVILTTMATSLTVEFVQLKIGRAFDIDDILLNLVGAIIGFLLYVGLNAISKRLPDALKSNTVKNIVTVIILGLFLIYVLGYWGVIFK